MSDMVNLVRVLTSATGNSTPITLGAAYSQLFMTPAEAGAVDGRTYTYLIVDGNNWELGKGAYTASGTTLARTIILASRISGTLGTSRITLSGTAQVRIVDAAEDMGALRGTRTVTGATDAIMQSDIGGAIVYNRATAIAASLAQAGASSRFLDGWSVHVKNIGAGATTITPATSTINGAATLVLPQNMGAFIWSDGTNYHAFVMPVTAPLLAANNLADVPNPSTARASIGAFGAVKKQTFTASGTYTPSANLIYAIIEAVGGGGGGGGVNGTSSQFYQGGGGGSGSYSRLVATAATIGASQTVTIGSGGTGGAGGNNTGSAGAGGDTSVGALCIAKGGSGGLHGSSGQVGAGGAGGVAGTGDIAAIGMPGNPGLYSTTGATAFGSGNGGSSIFGGGAQGLSGNGGLNGNNATGKGGGGSGASSNGALTLTANGGSGANGFVIITEFCSQ